MSHINSISTSTSHSVNKKKTLVSQSSCDLILKEFKSEFSSAINNEYILNLENPDFYSKNAFTIWIAQEYLFVQGLIKFFGSALSKSTSPDGLKILTRGLIFLSDDLNYLEVKMIEHSIDYLNITMNDETKDYLDFIESLFAENYSIQATFIWLILQMYYQSIQDNSFGSIFTELIYRWKGFEIAEILEKLKEESNRSLSQAQLEMGSLKNYINQLKVLEVNSWKMLNNTT